MKNIQFFATALFLTIALFGTSNLSAQWSQSATSIWNTNANLNLGIGTSTPAKKLQVNGGDGLSLGFGPGATGEGIGNRRSAGGNQFGLDFYTNNLAQMSITNAGNVGIGTSSPAAKFQVNVPSSSNPISAMSIDVQSFGSAANAAASYYFRVRDIGAAGFTPFYIRGDGNVGIGTSTPTDAKLQFDNSLGNKITMFDNGINGAYGFGVNNGNLCAYIPAANFNKFSVRTDDYNGAEKFVVTNAGNVGIGTSTPAKRLQVDGGDGLSFGFGPGATGEGIGNKRSAGGNQFGLDFYTNSLARMSVTNAGNVGIGTTTPDAKLRVWGGQIWATGADLNGTAIVTSSGGNAYFSNNTLTNGIAINPSGNVGIGTSAPSYKLHVAGDIRCYNLYSNSDRRYKANIKTLDGAMDKVMAMRGTSYDFAADRLPEGYTAGKQVGFIAQEMKTVMPELVKEDSEGMMSINYIGVIPVLVEALKEQHEVIAALEAQNSELQSRLARIEAALDIAADRQTEVKTEPVSTKVSPNPTSGLVTIDLQNTSTAKSVVVNIVDAAGRQVATRNAAGTSSFQFDLSQLPAGVYVAQVMADGKMVSSSKVQLVK